MHVAHLGCYFFQAFFTDVFTQGGMRPASIVRVAMEGGNVCGRILTFGDDPVGVYFLPHNLA